MKNIFTLLNVCFITIQSLAQAPAIDSGTFLLHKFAQKIGQESYVVRDSAGIKIYSVSFKYVDRGSPVVLSALLELNASMQPLEYFIKGGTSRFSQINDSIIVHSKVAFVKVDSTASNKNISENSFTVAGYSPATIQMLLIQFWKRKHMPANIPILPEGKIQVKKDGDDTFIINNQKLVLERFVITGLIWGNELLWTDSKGQLFCLITNDAEGDKQEMMYAPYESLLADFIERAAVYGMKLFTKSVKPSLRQHDVIVIKNGNIADVVNGKTLEGATVLIEKGIIKNIGRNIGIPPNAFVIEAKGKTVLPGLFDMHAHFEQAEWGPAYLAAGVTTVRDCGNEFVYINAVKNAIDNGSGIGPYILKAGIIDGKGPYSLGIVQADTKEEAITEVDRYKQNGFVQIKIYSSVKPAITKVICDEAHRLGLTVTGHIPEGMTLMQGVDSGMDMVNHVQYIFNLIKRNRNDTTINFNDSANAAIFSFIKAHHTVIDPTLGVFELAYRYLKSNIKDIEPNFATLPQPMKPLFLNTGAPADWDPDDGILLLKMLKQIVTELYKENITIAAGTDMGFPGYSLDRELELYVDCGLTPMQAIQCATITPAKVMKMQSETGSVEVGKRADIIVVSGNPLQNIRDIRNVDVVIKNSNVYDPKQLHVIAGFQK